MPHVCKLPYSDSVFEPLIDAKSKLKSKFLSYILISERNPLSKLYFRSMVAMKKEKIRHLDSGYPYIIHPFSKFRENYEKWLLVLYSVIVIIKPLDACVRNTTISYKEMFIFQMFISTATDFATWVDIILTFFTGCYLSHTRSVELTPMKIATKYIFGFFFILDVMGSIPRYLLHLLFGNLPLTFQGVLHIFCLLRIVRIISVLKFLIKTLSLIKHKSKTVIFSVCWAILLVSTLHFTTCFQMSIVTIIRINFGLKNGKKLKLQLQNKPFYSLYTECMLRSSAYFLGITLPPNYFLEIEFMEEYLTVIFAYIIGKILLISTWIILAISILATRSMKIKFYTVMNQLEHYMIQRQLPLTLREKLIQYYEFKYQGNYFKEKLQSFFLNDQLRKDINIELCRSLINKVTVLRELSTEEMNAVVKVLISEIFLPRDTIMQSGTIGDCMYFISSGTVAVYTHSGKEVCHLQDGAYFGEMSLVLKSQRRVATVVAIEITQVYRLKKSDFNRTLMAHKKVLRKIINSAEQKVKKVLELEEMHKRELFEQTYR